MRSNQIELLESEEEYLQFRRNSLNSDYLHEEDSDHENEKILSYFSDKIFSLEKSFLQRKNNTKKDFSTRDKEFLVDLIKTLFKEINDINDNCVKIYTRNINKTEKIKQITTIHKELYDKYSRMKMDYKSVIKQTEYKDKQILDLENLIKTCDLEILELKSKLNDLKDSLAKYSPNNANKQKFPTTKEIQEMISHHEKEKEDLNYVIENLRKSLVRKENISYDQKKEIEIKNVKIKELKEEVTHYKTELERCKMNLENEKKSHLAKQDELKNLTESFLRKRDYDSDDQNKTGFSKLDEADKRAKRKRYRTCMYSDRLINEIIFDEDKDINTSRRKLSHLAN